MLDRILTQSEFGQLVGITQQAVSDLVRAGVLKPNLTGQAWLHAYCERLREEAAGRAGRLADARAALDEERRSEIAMRNAAKRRELLSVGVMSEVIARVGRKSRVIFESIIPALRLRFPELSADQLRLIESELARARNELASMSVTHSDDDDAEDDEAIDT